MISVGDEKAYIPIDLIAHPMDVSFQPADPDYSDAPGFEYPDLTASAEYEASFEMTGNPALEQVLGERDGGVGRTIVLALDRSTEVSKPGPSWFTVMRRAHQCHRSPRNENEQRHILSKRRRHAVREKCVIVIDGARILDAKDTGESSAEVTFTGSGLRVLRRFAD